MLFAAQDLAGFDAVQVDAIILAALGSPDPDGRQVDGLGGGSSSLSKAAIVGPAPAGSTADVAYRFAQVDVTEPLVDFAGNCGNISAAIGPFALENGLVAAGGGSTDVVVLSVNTGQLCRARVPTRSGRYEPAGDFAIQGVPGIGSRIALTYIDPGIGLPPPERRASSAPATAGRLPRRLSTWPTRPCSCGRRVGAAPAEMDSDRPAPARARALRGRGAGGAGGWMRPPGSVDGHGRSSRVLWGQQRAAGTAEPGRVRAGRRVRPRICRDARFGPGPARASRMGLAASLDEGVAMVGPAAWRSTWRAVRHPLTGAMALAAAAALPGAASPPNAAPTAAGGSPR